MISFLWKVVGSLKTYTLKEESAAVVRATQSARDEIVANFILISKSS